MSEVITDYFLTRLVPVSSRIHRIGNENIVYKNGIKIKTIFTGFALFRQECRSAAMSEVRIDFLFWTKPYMCQEYVEFGTKILFKQI